MSGHSKPVYSTDSGRLCPACGRALADCECRHKAASAVQGDGRVRVQRETKGRKGKGVTLITGLPLTETELKALAKRLRQQCGTGGTVRDGIVEIQGDQRDRLVTLLREAGYEAKTAGG